MIVFGLSFENFSPFSLPASLPLIFSTCYSRFGINPKKKNSAHFASLNREYGSENSISLNLFSAIPFSSENLASKPFQMVEMANTELERKERMSPVRFSEENELRGTGVITRCCPSALSCLLGTMCFPLLLCSCQQLSEKTEAVILTWGKYSGTVKRPGLFVFNPCGTSFRIISTARCVINIETTKVTDANGNPILVSGVVTFHVNDSRKALLDVQDYRLFVENQALSALKMICSKYPYENDDEGVDDTSLRGETEVVKNEMKSVLQRKVDVTGVVVDFFELTDLSYAPEIAQAMLVRQQAHATIKARETIVSGAVEITFDALRGLEEKGIVLSSEEKAKLASNLLVTICGESKVQPTINLG